MADWDDDDFDLDSVVIKPVQDNEELAMMEEEEDLAMLAKAERLRKEAAMAALPKEKVVRAAPAPKKTAAEVPKGPMSSEEKRKIIEEQMKGDYALAQDLFGGAGGRTAPKKATAFSLGHGVTFETFVPESESDFEGYAKYIGERIAIFDSDFHYRSFIKSLFKHAVNGMTAEDIKEVAHVLNMIQNDKIKAGKTKKKTTTTKKTLTVDSATSGSRNTGGDAAPADDFDEDDFM